MIIEEIVKYNEEFVARRGYEQYVTSKYPDKKLAIRVWIHDSPNCSRQRWD